MPAFETTEKEIEAREISRQTFSFIKQTPSCTLPSTTGKRALLLLGFFQTSDMISDRISYFFSAGNAQRYRMILSPW